MKPAIRLAAIMRLPVIYIGTHDSIGLGEDGPTHQPIEHLAMLRAIPNLDVIRPADATETVEAWRAAMSRTDGPTLLALTRQKLPVLDRDALGRGRRRGRAARTCCSTRRADTRRRSSSPPAPRSTWRSAAAKLLQADRVRVRVVSMPSWELFAQPAGGVSRRGAAAGGPRAARRSRRRPRSAGSAGSPTTGAMLAMTGFGASAPGDRLFEEFKFTPERAAAIVRQLLAQRHAPGRNEAS